MIRPWRPGDEDGLLALHNREFAGHPERALAHWRWKFRDNPLRRTEIVLAEQDGRIVGAYTGVTLPFVVDGERCLAGLHVDVAVDGAHRDGLAGARLLAALMRRYFELYAGGETRLTWGYPEPALQRIGLRFVKFHVLRDVTFLVRPSEPAFAGTAGAAGPAGAVADDAGPGSAAGAVHVVRAARFGDDVDALWERCRAEIGTGVVRDRAYLQWRYADHPDVEHVLLEARGGDGALRGIAVAREGGWDTSLLSVLDWLVPHDDRAAEHALLAACRAEALRRGRAWIACWLAGAPVPFHRFQTEHGFFAQVTPYQECFRSWIPGATRRRLNESWYQTMGDIDFF